MKGRAAYPCTYHSNKPVYMKVIKDIKNGQVRQPRHDEPNCSTAPCRDSKDVYLSCVAGNGECPYTVAMETAQEHPNVIHNIHSFIFQTSFASKFEKRELLVIDEVHEVEATIREFIGRKFTLPKVIQEEDRPVGT